MSQKLLVTGASGHLGQQVITHLIETYGVSPERIVATTRNPEKLAALAAKGVSIRKADFDDAASVTAAFSSVHRLLLISTDALDKPGRRLAQHRTAIESAKKAGVRHVVYTSMPNPEGSLVSFAPDHLGTEQALTASGLGWTILRNCWYMENLNLAIPAALESGKWFTSAGNGRLSHVSRDDCARAAAGALIQENSPSSRYDITGPEKRTFAEIAALISEVHGKPIEVVNVTDEQLTQGLVAAGVPAPVATMLTSFDANTRAGKFDVLSDAVEKLTGKPPRKLRDFLIASR